MPVLFRPPAGRLLGLRRRTRRTQRFALHDHVRGAPGRAEVSNGSRWVARGDDRVAKSGDLPDYIKP